MTDTNYSYYTDPGQEFFLQQQYERDIIRQRSVEALARKPGFVSNLAEFSTLYPTSSAELGLALAQGGIPASDPMVQTFVNQELAVRDTLGPVEKSGGGVWDSITGIWDEAVDNNVKGAVRWGFAAWDAAYQMLAGGAPIRARELARQEDISYTDAWKQQDPYFFEALGGVIAGEEVNLGSGWLPNSDVADDVRQNVNLGMENVERETSALGTNERYVKRLEAAPGVWRDAVSQSAEQAAMGRPITGMNYADTESVIFDVNSWAGGNTRTPWSPGRLLAANLTEPGTAPFGKISGSADFMSQIFLDPVDWVGGAWAKAGVAGRRIWGVSRKVASEAAKLDDAAQVMRALPAGETVKALPAPVDRSRALIGGMGPQYPTIKRTEKVWNPVTEQFDEITETFPSALPGETPVMPEIPGRDAFITDEAGVTKPWWLDTKEYAGRVARAFDPPEWFINLQRSRQDRAVTRAVEAAPAKPKRVVGGVYTMDLPRIPGTKQKQLRIQRQGKGKNQFWEVVGPDGSRVATPVGDPRLGEEVAQFKRLDEATEAAERYAYGAYGEELSVYGMTPDEFIQSGESFYVGDDIAFLKSTSRAAKNSIDEPRVMHQGRKYAPDVPPSQRGNARIQVFGKTVDLTDGRAADNIPKGLRDALSRDRKIRGGELIGFGDPSIEKFENTLFWMENNGYGKLHWDDETVLVADKFVGGSTKDPLLRMWYEDGGRPMHTFGEGLSTPTPREIDEIVQTLADTGRYSPEELGRMKNQQDLASKVRQADIENAPPQTIDGPRPDFDPDFELQGKKVDAFIDRMVSTSRAGGQKTMVAMDELLSFFDKQGIELPNRIRQALFDARSPESMKSTLAKWLVEEGGQEFLLPGGTAFGRLSAIPGVRPVGVSVTDNRWMGKQLAESIGGSEINMVENPSGAYRLYNRALPNYKLKRGDVVQRLDERGVAMEGQTISVENVFERLRNLRPGDKREAFEIQGEWTELLFSHLASQNMGVDPRLARRSARWFKDNGEKALYDAERFARPDLDSLPYDTTLVADETIGGLGPGLTADMWTGALKPVDSRTMRRITSESDLLGRISNRVSHRWVDDDGTLVLHERAAVRALDTMVQKIWKPFVLLRAAWTLRIAIDDQFRLAAEGYNILNHPLRVFNYALTRPSDWKDAFMKGQVDIFGTKMAAGNIDEMMHGDVFKASLMSARDPKLGPGAYGSKMHVPAYKGDTKYAEGLTFELQRLRGSPMTKRLVNSNSTDPVDEAVRWLKGEGPTSGREAAAVELANQAHLHRKMGDVSDKILEGDYDTLYNVVNRQWGLLHHRMGGDVVLDTGQGQLLSMGRNAPVGTVEATGKARWVVNSKGDDELLALVGGQEKVNNVFYGDIASIESRRLVEKLIKRKVKTSERFPVAVRVPKEPQIAPGQGTLTQMLDNGVSGIFDWAMTRPSNFLSRSPEFRRAYWRKMSDLYPYMDETLRAKIDDMAPFAEKANLKRALKDKRLPDIEGQLTDFDQADLHAKSFGVTMVENTLFSLSNELSGRRNVSDALRLVFPFAEAWGEFLSRWGRLMVSGDRNLKNVNRFRQAVGGARRSGFFSENDYGQEVFNYPSFMTKAQVGLQNTLNNLPIASQLLGGDVSPEVASSINATGTVESMNFASGVIPGFGPVFQMAAKQLPNNPDFDWLRELIAPFGTEGDLVGSFAPAWLKRVVSAYGGGDDPQLSYTYNSTVIDIIRTKIDNGEFAGVTDQVAVNAIVKDAEQEAKGLLMVRAAAAFWNPSSPQYTFQKEDEDGLIWSYNNLGGAYYDLQNELGDDAAFDEFYRRFGFLPQAFRGGKTYSVLDRARTEGGFQFERANPELFEQYPGTAMYFDPGSGGDSPYDHGATLSQLRRGLREAWPGEQFMFLQQDQLGDLWWDNVLSSAELIPNKPTKDAYLASRRDEISRMYPLWNQKIPGRRQAMTNDQQMAEIQRALNDRSLIGVASLEAARMYENARESLLVDIRAAGASSIDGPKSRTSKAGIIATQGRAWLREVAKELAIEYPQFEPLYRSVYSYEVDVSRDAPTPPVIDVYGEGDIFEELGVVNG